MFEVGAGKHEANTNNRQWSGGISDVADSVGDEARQRDVREEQNHAEEDGDNVGVRDDAFYELGGDFVFEKIDAVGKQGDVESNDEATVGDDSLWAEGARDDGVAEESGVVKNKGELGFVAEAAFEPPFVEYEFREDDEHQHDEDSSEEAGGEQVQGGFVVFAGKGAK